LIAVLDENVRFVNDTTITSEVQSRKYAYLTTDVILRHKQNRLQFEDEIKQKVLVTVLGRDISY